MYPLLLSIWIRCAVKLMFCLIVCNYLEKRLGKDVKRGSRKQKKNSLFFSRQKKIIIRLLFFLLHGIARIYHLWAVLYHLLDHTLLVEVDECLAGKWATDLQSLRDNSRSNEPVQGNLLQELLLCSGIEQHQVQLVAGLCLWPLLLLCLATSERLSRPLARAFRLDNIKKEYKEIFKSGIDGPKVQKLTGNKKKSWKRNCHFQRHFNCFAFKLSYSDGIVFSLKLWTK